MLGRSFVYLTKVVVLPVPERMTKDSFNSLAWALYCIKHKPCMEPQYEIHFIAGKINTNTMNCTLGKKPAVTLNIQK